MDATLYLSPFRSNVGAMLGSGSGSSSNGSVPALEEAKRRRQEAEAALFAADSQKWEASIKKDLASIKPGRYSQLHVMAQSPSHSGDAKISTPIESARYTITIVDGEPTPSQAQQPCGVLLVPAGREHEFLFGVPEGQRKLTADSGFQRIIFVAQNPGHVFPALSEAVQQELSPLVLPLAPLHSRQPSSGRPASAASHGHSQRNASQRLRGKLDKLHGAGGGDMFDVEERVPFLAIGDQHDSDLPPDASVTRTVLYEHHTALNGRVQVTDVVITAAEGSKRKGKRSTAVTSSAVRRLIFLKSGIVQSEVRLRPKGSVMAIVDNSSSGAAASAAGSSSNKKKKKKSAKKPASTGVEPVSTAPATTVAAGVTPASAAAAAASSQQSASSPTSVTATMAQSATALPVMATSADPSVSCSSKPASEVKKKKKKKPAAKSAAIPAIELADSKDLTQSNQAANAVQDNIINQSVVLQYEVDHSYLPVEYQRAVVAGLAIPEPALLPQSDAECSFLLIGLGAGVLASFLQRSFPRMLLTCVDLDLEVTNIAQRFFGFQPSQSTRVHVTDGLELIRQLAVAVSTGAAIKSEAGAESKQSAADVPLARKQDVILIDVNAQDLTTGMTFPPAEFVTNEFLQHVRTCLSDRGMLVVNVGSRSESMYQQTMANIHAVFPEVYQIQMEEELNKVVFALPTGPGNGKAGEYIAEAIFDRVMARTPKPPPGISWDPSTNPASLLRKLKYA